jgi:hypothetical protein
MPEATTIPETVEVPTAALFETIGYLEHLADVIVKRFTKRWASEIAAGMGGDDA